MSISLRLKRAILSSELNYYELEKLTKIPKSAIQRYASGKTKKIPVQRLETLSKVLHVSMNYLLGQEPSEKPPPSPFLQAVTESENELLRYGRKLNEVGLERLTEYAGMLSQNPKYQNPVLAALPDTKK